MDVIKFNPEPETPCKIAEAAKIIQFENTFPLNDFGIKCRIDENTAKELCIHRRLITWNQVDYCYKIVSYDDLQTIKDIIAISTR